MGGAGSEPIFELRKVGVAHQLQTIYSRWNRAAKVNFTGSNLDQPQVQYSALR